jgi:hypothetical protein
MQDIGALKSFLEYFLMLQQHRIGSLVGMGLVNNLAICPLLGQGWGAFGLYQRVMDQRSAI